VLQFLDVVEDTVERGVVPFGARYLEELRGILEA
jgi:hypothetical protein